jgi:hypothetical protein
MTDNRPKGLYVRYLEKLAQRRTEPVKDVVDDEQRWRERAKWHHQEQFSPAPTWRDTERDRKPA